MMIITSTTIKDFQLLLAARLLNHEPKLIFINWLNDEHWQHSKTLTKLKAHYNLAESDITFKTKNSLSNKNPVESLLLSAITQLQQYSMGTRQTFDLPIDTSTGTPFQQKVWQALQHIDYAQTISYAQLAENINQPTAYRAVANANGQNPFSIVIPCHRVISSDGGLGGYTGGLDKKRWLLNIET